ncbi:Coagulation factor IX [Amphibalanus amphitrite]|uniref:Coagulation factor IX n=1 Tax=Amphibalanus amphitrite TaxID=1232801 RepID=A0A6A4VKC6_AMPAM|nr:chymotrypsinogen A-like [Amphibalanus amphitrite]KAF0291760.1 Coagulation factor IX [Amphibalanus amphitrite]
MNRLLIISCLALGVAVAKPGQLRAAAPYDAEDEAVPYGDKVQAVPYQEVVPLTLQPSRAVQVLNAGNYRFTSPNFPNQYPNNLRLTVTVQGAEDQAVSISCSPFSLEWSFLCWRDVLSINNVRYCGSGDVPTITAAQLAIELRTDSSGTSTGFHCTITVPRVDGTTQAPVTTQAPATTQAPVTTQAPSTGGCRCGQRQSGRVVGGTEAAIGAFPWQAGLVSPGGTRTFCGGSVINNRYVLTAAHCTADLQTASDIQVLLGDHNIGTTDAGEQRYSVVQIIDHLQYTNASGSGWDFSLLKLDREITYSSTISPVCLAEAGETYAGATATASGFGRLGATSPQATSLQQIDLPVWSESDCMQRWGSTIKSNMICAGGKSTGGEGVCMGDSGGPLVTEVSGSYRLIGVVSFGQPCAVADWPDVFARVSEALTWIQSNTADAQYCSA